jgi:putative endonuclease
MERQPFVYMLASQRRGTIYTGVTSNLMQRLWEHRNKAKRGFTERYEVLRLVHYEAFEDMASAIAREKQIKRWHRPWKINLIEEKIRIGMIWRWGLVFRHWRMRRRGEQARHAELVSASICGKGGAGDEMDPETSSG